jgi:hypothetical protein
MTSVTYVSGKEMARRTGMPAALGYSFPKADEILIRKGLPEKVEAHVREHEAEHIANGEEGPFLGAILGGALIGGISSIIGGSKAAKSAKSAANTATAEQRRQFDLVREDTASQRALGESATARLSRLYGYGPNGATSAPDMGAFQESPDYQFNLQETQSAIDRSAAARGGLLSGRAVKEGERYASGLASREYGSYVDRLMQQAGLGSAGVNTSANAGANAANNISNIAVNAGAQRGSAYQGMASGVNSAVQGGISNYLLTQYLKPAGA